MSVDVCYQRVQTAMMIESRPTTPQRDIIQVENGIKEDLLFTEREATARILRGFSTLGLSSNALHAQAAMPVCKQTSQIPPPPRQRLHRCCKQQTPYKNRVEGLHSLESRGSRYTRIIWVKGLVRFMSVEHPA